MVKSNEKKFAFSELIIIRDLEGVGGRGRTGSPKVSLFFAPAIPLRSSSLLTLAPLTVSSWCLPPLPFRGAFHCSWSLPLFPLPCFLVALLYSSSRLLPTRPCGSYPCFPTFPCGDTPHLLAAPPTIYLRLLPTFPCGVSSFSLSNSGGYAPQKDGGGATFPCDASPRSMWFHVAPTLWFIVAFSLLFPQFH